LQNPFIFTIIANLIGVIYSCITTPGPNGFEILNQAVQTLLEHLKSAKDEAPKILYTLRYMTNILAPIPSDYALDAGYLPVTELSDELQLDNSVLTSVEKMWRAIMGDDAEDEFLMFEDRQPVDDEED
jgi:hypothetical protein